LARKVLLLLIHERSESEVSLAGRSPSLYFREGGSREEGRSVGKTEEEKKVER